MLEFRPEETIEAGERTFYGYRAYEGEEEIGRCTFEITERGVELVTLIFSDDDPLTAEGLVRSALNFGANRGAYMSYAKEEKVPAELFCRLGFELKGEEYSADIPSVLLGGCSGCRH